MYILVLVFPVLSLSFREKLFVLKPQTLQTESWHHLFCSAHVRVCAGHGAFWGNRHQSVSAFKLTRVTQNLRLCQREEKDGMAATVKRKCQRGMSDLQSWTVLMQVCNSVLVILKESASLTMQFKRQPKWESFFFISRRKEIQLLKF